MDPVIINGMPFERVEGCNYRFDYYKLEARIKADPKNEINLLRTVMKQDLWFIVYFVLKCSIANHPFWVQACRDITEGPVDSTLDMWAREHGKSTIITTAETIQDIIKNAEERICLFSHTKAVALSFFRAIKYVLETSDILRTCFPDILYQEPDKEAWKWSEDAGLFVQRKGNYKEPTLMAAGLIEGMPTSYHFTKRKYDDVETMDTVNTPEVSLKLREAFDMSQNLGTTDGSHRVIGTPYSHEGLLTYIMSKVDPLTGLHAYHVRKKPATVDGTLNGASVYMPENRLAVLRTNIQMFRSQQLLDPTPKGTESINPAYLNLHATPPDRLLKFMLIDSAGTEAAKRGDSWAILVVGVEPFRDDIGASDIYLLDACIEPMPIAEALENIVRMYNRNGRVLKIGVEKAALSSTEIHVANALHAAGKHLTVDNGRIVLLRPGGRSKEDRIESSLVWSLNNGKVHICDTVAASYVERIKLEMRKFPFWHDDALDAFSYIHDMLKDYKFGKRPDGSDSRSDGAHDKWDEAFKKQDIKRGWLTC